MSLYFHTIHQLITKGHLITDQVGKAMKEFGMTEPQYNVLRLLFAAMGKPLTVQEVQMGMVQKGSNVTRIVDKLQAKGLVDRQECATNRRKMDLTLTEKGSKLLKVLDQKVYELHRPVIGSLSKQELQQLSDLLNKLKIEEGS